jgi:hypothetical protein
MPIVDPLLNSVVDRVRLPDKSKIETNFSDYIPLFHTQTAKRLLDNFYFIVTAGLRLRHDANAVEMAYFLIFDQQLRSLTDGKFGLDHPECINRWRDLYILAVTVCLTAIADMPGAIIKKLYVADLYRMRTKYDEEFANV